MGRGEALRHGCWGMDAPESFSLSFPPCYFCKPPLNLLNQLLVFFITCITFSFLALNLNGLNCAAVPLRIYSLTYFFYNVDSY